MSETATNKWPKRIGLALLGVFAGLIIAAIILVLLLRSGPGRDFVEARIESMEFVGQTVEIDGLNGSVLGRFGVDRITLKGRDGPWLIAQDVSVEWGPRALLSKTLNVDRVRVGDLDILQRPILVPGESGGDPAVTRFDIKGIDLPDVNISDSLFGQMINLSASGNLLHGPDGGAAVLSARSDQGDIVETDLRWSHLLVLSGEADIDGAPGGLIAGLLRLNPEQRVTADVSTRDQQTRVLAKIDGIEFTVLIIERGQSSASVTGTIETTRLPPLERIAPYLGGTTDIDAVLPLDQGAAASLTLRSPRITLEATGERRDGTIVLDRVTLNATDPLKPLELDGITIGRIIAEGRGVIGELYEFEGTVEGTNLHYQTYKVDRLAGPITLTFSDGMLGFDTSLRGQATQSFMARASGARLVAKGAVDLSNQTMSLSQADINLPGLAVRGQGEIGYGARKAANFTGRYNIDTSLFRDGPSAILTGRAAVRQTASGPIAELSGQAQKIDNIPSAVEPLLVGGLNYTAQLKFEPGRVIVPRFNARNERVTASGTARWQEGQLSSDIQYSTDRYEFGAVSAADVTGTAVLSGPPGALTFKTDLGVQTLTTGALDVSDAALSATGTYSDGVIALTGSLVGDSPQGRVSTQADITLADGGWDVTALDGTLGTFKATGGISGLGSDLASIRADLVFSGTSQLIPADAMIANVLVSDSQVDIDATLDGVTVGPLQNGTIHILAKGPRGAVTYQINTEGMTVIEDLERPLKAQVNGLIDLSDKVFATQADFDAAISDLALAGTATVQRADTGWDAALNAAGLGGAFSLALDPADAGALSFNLDSLSVPQLARLIGRPATEGTVSGEGRFAIVADNVEGAAQISLNDLRSPISDSEPITVAMDVTLADEQLAVALGATEGGLSGQARLAGGVETLPRAPFLIYPPAVPLAGSANLGGEIGPIVELFLPPRTNVAGQIETDVSFTVPSTPTGLQGRIALTEGVFEQGALGLELIDIAILAELSGETITVPRLSARGRDGGTLEGSGRMGLGEGTGTVDIKAEKLRVLSRREGQAEVSGTLDVSRTAELLRLGGMLRVTDADLNISRLPKPGLPTLEVDFGEEQAEEEMRSFASSATEIDIRIVSDGRIKVRGRGLNASMNLDAAVRGPFDAPVVTGQMSVDRGRFDFLSKRFEFRESTVTLRENVLQSRLSLEAVRQTTELTAVVAITGTLERPEIKLTSEPNLPEDEVLSRILFGRSPTQLSAIETARLAAAISQLSGGSGFDLFGTLENAIGLDTLEIGQNDTGQTQLTTGKYLSDDVYLEVRTAAEGTPGVAVEWQVRDNVSLEAETLPNERQRLSVQWKKDFD
jgi:translocation and assembly module TamB